MAKTYICQKEGCENEILQNRGNRRKFCYEHRRYKRRPGQQTVYVTTEDKANYMTAKRQREMLQSAWG